MKKFSLGLALVSMLGVLACGETEEAGGDAKVDAPTAMVAKKSSEKMQGNWQIVLSEEEKRQVAVLQLALKDPAPTEEDMTKMKLSDDEKMMVALMAAAKAEDPKDPKVAEMKAAADGLANATVTITPTKMTFKAGPVSDESTYTVASETATTVTIKAKGADEGATEETATITFDGNDKMSLSDPTDPTKKQNFTRKK